MTWWRKDPGGVLDLPLSAALEYRNTIQVLEAQSIHEIQAYYWSLYEKIKTLIRHTDSSEADEAYEQKIINRMTKVELILLIRHLWVMQYYQREVLKNIISGLQDN